MQKSVTKNNYSYVRNYNGIIFHQKNWNLQDNKNQETEYIGCFYDIK